MIRRGGTLFNYSDRFPTGSPLPKGVVTPAPWILRRIAPYPPFEAPDYASVELDTATQMARYLDADSVPILMGRPAHGTSSGTNPPTGTTGQGDRQGGDAPDNDTGNDTDQ